MPRLRPVALTIYANDQDAYLDKLEAEQQAIDDALSSLDDNGFIKLHKESFTSSQRLIDLCIRYHGRIMLLHYAGHASGTQLSFKGGAAHGKGLAQLLKGIPFVFLNGCASQGHVSFLLENGVNAVIATSVAINDSKALEFASSFYKMLSNGHSLGEAFDTAKEGIELKYGSKAPVVKKGLKLRKNKADAAFEWGIYTEKENIYNWKLPDKVFQSELDKVKEYNNEQLLKPNRYLVKNVYKAIRKYSDAAQRIRNERKITQPKPNYSEGVQVIGESFLTPISEELRRLFTAERSKSFDIKRLKQIITVYQRTIELFAFTLLSQVWNEIEDLEITDEQRRKLQIFFELDEYAYPTFDYFDFIRLLKDILEENKQTCFLEEIQELDFSETAVLSKSIAFLDELKNEIHSIQAELVEKTCQQAEEKLTNILSQLYFLVKYKLIVIKQINISRLKKQAANFVHDIIILDNNKNNTQPDGKITLNPFTDSDSVIIFKEEVSKGLNLAPFIIDQNALRKESNSRIHYFSHQNTQGQLCYLSINDQSMLTISQQDDDDEFDDSEINPYKVVVQQFKNAKNDTLGLTPVPKMVTDDDDDFDDDDDDWDDD